MPILPMNTGAEAVETAIKAARRWAYDVKGAAPDQQKLLRVLGNFHGRQQCQPYPFHQKKSTNADLARCCQGLN